jgi:hypothetical protein
MERSQRVSFINQILNVSPNLKHLVVEWRDFHQCSKIYSNLKHLQLILDYSTYENAKPFDVNRLFQLTPNISHLETSRANLMSDQRLVEFIWQIIPQFNQLIHLLFNKNSLYPSKEKKKCLFKQLLINAGHQRLYPYVKIIHITFRIYDEVSIWL